MKETYRHEFNWWQKVVAGVTSMWRINQDSIDFKWGYFAPRFGLELRIHRGGYFDPHYALTWCFIWGVFHLKLPFKTSLGEGCDLPCYGFYVMHNQLVMEVGGKFDKEMGQVSVRRAVHWDIPFVSWEFEFHKVITSRGPIDTKVLEQELKAKGEKFPWYMNHPDFKKSTAVKTLNDCDGPIEVEISYCVDIRQWHRKWLPCLKMKHTDLNMDFDKEMGPRKGSWKGGTVGMSTKIEKGETPEQALDRFALEHEFNR